MITCGFLCLYFFLLYSLIECVCSSLYLLLDIIVATAVDNCRDSARICGCAAAFTFQSELEASHELRAADAPHMGRALCQLVDPALPSKSLFVKVT